jgi:hypothetical protein
MTSQPDYERWGIFRVNHQKAPFGDPRIVGGWAECAEQIPDNHFVNAKLKVINDAAAAERRLDDERSGAVRSAPLTRTPDSSHVVHSP